MLLTPIALLLACQGFVLAGADFSDALSIGVMLGSAAPVVSLRRRRGRPRKFDEPTRVVSLTLPESVIASLSKVHADLGYAVAGLIRGRRRQREGAELVPFGNRAVISVRRSDALERKLGVELVPTSHGRALIAFDAPHTIADLELRLHDALEDTSLAPADRATFEAIRAILRDARRSEQVVLLRRSIIVLESRRGRARVNDADGVD